MDWFKPDSETAELVEQSVSVFQARMAREVGSTAVELEAREEVIRTQETNFTNFVADMFRTEYGSDFGFVYNGSLGLNEVIPVGNFPL